MTTEVILPGLDPELVRQALDGLELSPGIEDAIRAAVNSRGSVFIYGSPGNGKTSLARRIPRLLRGPILVPHAIDLGGGEVMSVFDPAVHRLDSDQPHDARWMRVVRPLVQMGGEFTLEMLTATWDPGSRTYQAPLQLKANGGVLLIDDFGRQPVTPKQTLDRLMVPLEQAVDHLQLAGSGRKVEIPFRAMLVFSTNLTPKDLLDEAYLRRLAYKIRMPDPTPQIYQRIFERERERLGIPPNPQVFGQIGQLYGSMSIRGNHPRDLLERLVDVASARGVQPSLSPELIEAAWRTLFVAT
jgi:Mg-chelatase subunit ChlI